MVDLGAAWSWPLRLAVAVGVVLAAAVALTWIVLWAHRRSRRRKLRMVIQNLGNVRCSYELRVEELPDAQLYFAIGGARLSGRDVAVERAPQVVARAAPARAGPNVAAVGDLIAGLGALLSGKVGRPFKRAAQGMRKVQSKEQQAARLRDRADGAFGAAKATNARPAAATMQMSFERWSQTPPVEPGERLFFDLYVAPRDPYRGQHYPLVVRSRPVGRQEDEPPVAKKTLYIGGVPWGWRIVPLAVVWGGACIAVFVLWRWLSSGGWS